jgi:Zn-dependent protease
MALYGIMINIVLMVLNLLPIPPLDGSKIVSSFMSPKVALQYNSIERYGFIILIALIIIPFNGGNLLSQIMRPFISIILDIVQAISF